METSRSTEMATEIVAAFVANNSVLLISTES